MRRFRAPLLSIAFLLAFVASPAARADSVDQFTYTANGHTFVWQLPASPTVGAGDFVLGEYFTLFNVQYSEDGGALVSGTFDFFNADPLVGGGFDLLTSTSDILIDAFGAQVYISSEAAPTFVPDTYKFDDFAGDVTTGTLVISSVPEPSVLLLLGAGFLTLALGFSFRKAMA